MITSEPHDATWQPDSRVRQAFETVRTSIALFGVVGGIVLATLAAVTLLHGAVNAFMWVRAVVLLLIAPVLYRLAGRAARGARTSAVRIRVTTTVLPIAIVVVDLIPGVCPWWYAVMQMISAVPLVGVAVLVRRPPLSAAYD